MVPRTLPDPHVLSHGVSKIGCPLPREDGLLPFAGRTISVLFVRLQHQVCCLNATGIVAAMRDLQCFITIERELGLEVLVELMSCKIRNCRSDVVFVLVIPPWAFLRGKIATVVDHPNLTMGYEAIRLRVSNAEQPVRVIQNTLGDLAIPDCLRGNHGQIRLSLRNVITLALHAQIERSTKNVECSVVKVFSEVARHCYLSNKNGTAYSRDHNGITSGQVVFD